MMSVLARMRVMRHRAWQGLVLLVLALLLSSCGWRGISNVAIPGGPGTGPGPTPSTCRCRTRWRSTATVGSWWPTSGSDRSARSS